MIMKTTNGKITPVERNSRDKSANNRSKSRNERESMSLNKTSIDKNADQQYSYTPTIKATYKPLDIFSKDELMPNCKPIFLSKSTQKLFNIIADEEITKESSIILLNKLDILKDIQLRASISDFSIEKNAIKNYPNSQILLIYDSDYKFNQNFIIVLSEEIKLQILNSIEQTNDNHAEEDNNEKKNEIDENVYNNNDNEYNDTSSFIFKTKSNHDWIDLGSKNEIIEMNSIELRSKICTIYQRSRKQFGSVLHLHDDNAIINKSFTEYISMHEDKSFNIPIIELDKSITNCIIKYDKSINTQWKYPKNAFTQYMPRMYTSNELQQFYHNNVLRNMPNLYTLFKQNLLENEMYNFLSNDYENLSTNDEIYDDDNNNNNDHHLFKEYLSFTDLKYTTSISEHLTYNQRIDQLSRILLQSTYIIIWSLNDPLKPQLLLNAPEDIICFQFNPTNINYIAGGCINGQVVLWDIEKYLNHLIHIKQYLKQINNKKKFIFI
ncbi:hypothetical protein MN116_003558 [Schistosoma mekongi]|uniref:WD repeat-containing protein 63 n=1 Tax=Schistosoma mekongi TaxID=38744 RepID=A0AAE1ZE06_SCHME|nr:hypothetical protein MN116_003558 [Schistosoma mekongi]